MYNCERCFSCHLVLQVHPAPGVAPDLVNMLVSAGALPEAVDLLRVFAQHSESRRRDCKDIARCL